MAITGIITNISMKQGNTNGTSWRLYNYKLDNGKSYTAFKKFNVEEGDTVQISMEKKGNKWQVKDIKKISNSSGVKNSQVKKDNIGREISIQRQSSLKVATEIVANNLDITKIINIADLLVEYCQNGKSQKLEEELSAMILDEIEENEEGLEGALEEE